MTSADLADPGPAAANPSLAAPDLSALRILFVDDDQFIRFTLKRVLRSLGIADFREAADGNAALRLLEGEFHPDVILCDVKMSPIDGPTFLRRLRASAHPGNASVPVILLTGVADDEIMQETSGLGVASYLQKPVTAGQLGECLSKTFHDLKTSRDPAAQDRAEPLPSAAPVGGSAHF